MITIFSPTNTDFGTNGDAILMPISCQVTAEINGNWSINIQNPIDDRWENIVDGSVVKVDSFNGEQLFRLTNVVKSDNGIVATGQPIFMDAIGDCFIEDKRPTNATGQQALSSILSPNSKYQGESNISAQNTAYYQYLNAVEAIAGVDNSFLNRWGGEIEYDNYTIRINDRMGEDNGVQILYGKNIPVDGLRETINVDAVVTRIAPTAYNGRKLSTVFVDSPLISAYPTIKTKVMDFPQYVLKEDLDGDPQEGQIVCNAQADLDAALRQACMEQFTNGLDKPQVTIEVQMIMLQNTEEYRDLKDLETVSLGDTVHCRHSRLGIETDARIVALTWDCIRKSVEAVTIGTIQKNIMDRIATAVQATEKALTPEGTVIASNVQGIIDGANARIIAQARDAESQREKVMLFEDLNPSSPTFGAMAIGTTGFVISDTRNSSDTDWVWSTFGTGKGFSADLIVAGTLSAINIIGSVITGGTITGTDISGTTITGSTINGTEISSEKTTSGITKKASLVDGEFAFSRTGTGSGGRMDGYTDIDGSGVTVEYPNATIPFITNIGYGIRVSYKNTPTSYCEITPNNIQIFENGTRVWSAR